MLIVKAFAVDIVAVNNLWPDFSDCQTIIIILRSVVVWAFSVNRIPVLPSVSITVITLYALTVLRAPCFTVVIYSHTHVLLSIVVCSWDTLEASLTVRGPLCAVRVLPSLQYPEIPTVCPHQKDSKHPKIRILCHLRTYFSKIIL